MQKTYERLAFAIRNGRKREKLTQAELAERLHMSIRTIQDIENQKTQIEKTAEELAKIQDEAPNSAFSIDAKISSTCSLFETSSFLS